jgi:hypothetical protein
MRFKRGQVTIFIILAILIVALVAVFFIFKDRLIGEKVPSEIAPVYNTFLSCLEQDLITGIGVLESQGGYIYLPEYEAGSDYMPFSSQLDFLGNPIPYWYYISGSSIPREQVPSKTDMENELKRFIDTKTRTCYFDNYYLQGFNILMEEPDSKVTIKEHEVFLDLKMDISISIDDESYVATEHNIVLDSELGSLYDSAIKVNEKEKEELFLEDYGIDVLRLYAPVDGVELSCSPKIWNANEVFSDLKEAVEANTLALKNSNDKNDYFDIEVSDIPSSQRVRFLNSHNWTSTYEVNPSEGQIMIANPIGNQQGMGILGFCYVPYHFVYSMKYPVLVQVISGNAANEIFQFPLAVVINRNQPRNVSGGEAVTIEYDELCQDKNTIMDVSVFDSSLRPVAAYISYECLGTKCNMGTAENGRLSEEFPQCVNGFIHVRADGYKDESIMYSTINEGSLSIYLNKLYDLDVQLKLNKQNYNKDAVISFISEDFSRTVYYPQQKSVELAEGTYEVEVQVYKNSSLKLGATTQEQCVEIPRSSIWGVMGLTKEECFDVQVPEQVLSSALSGGGKVNYTFSEKELRSSKAIDIYAESFPNPNSLEQVQMNYILFEDTKLEIDLR